MIIKNIFDGVFDEETHSAFLKFGRGEYHVKYLTEVKRQKDKWAIKTGAEFANFLVKKCLEDSEESIEVQTVKIKFTTVPTTVGSAAAGTVQITSVDGESVTIQFEGVLELQINK